MSRGPDPLWHPAPISAARQHYTIARPGVYKGGTRGLQAF